MTGAAKKVCLIVMDGWGVGPESRGNATAQARTPNLDALARDYPSTTIETSGLAVGLPPGQMGNSEVGHLTLGAGRVVLQDLTRINSEIASGALDSNPALEKLFEAIKDRGGALHLMGLVSDGGVHSHVEHLYALIDHAKEAGLERVFVHAFLDGRDTPPKSGKGYVEKLVAFMSKHGCGLVATVAGRFYAMDRDSRWERVEKAYKAILRTPGNDAPTAENAASAVEEAYKRGETDEFVLPTVITGPGIEDAGLGADDGVIFFNFRSDRARELTRALTSAVFDGFERGGLPAMAGFVTMSEYDASFDLPVLFETPDLEDVLGGVISREGLGQLRVAETEKYAHVTFFFNGGREEPYPGEERVLIPSDKEVATYDLHPEMRAEEIAGVAATKIRAGGAGGGLSFVLINFANGDMVGHTGVMEAAIRACESVDRAVGNVVEAGRETGWTIIITSDHGNAESMIDPVTNAAQTAHTTGPVPLIIVDDDLKGRGLSDGCGLKDVAPTVLKLMHIARPASMQGEPLF